MQTNSPRQLQRARPRIPPVDGNPLDALLRRATAGASPRVRSWLGALLDSDEKASEKTTTKK
jgi:hypothetical protein